jgi:hypothetical protein
LTVVPGGAPLAIVGAEILLPITAGVVVVPLVTVSLVTRLGVDPPVEGILTGGSFTAAIEDLTLVTVQIVLSTLPIGITILKGDVGDETIPLAAGLLL